ncbi:D-lactate dehydrogenase [Thalassobacter stenotrophicus]|uniref:D-lactate dehydrogenase n=1 Tax=Thalassobacter stenotrophicus TaxID=266809 RepID=UPI0022A91747|nr:D-lactate dehydrogenase [Thalassobacter stenotrophicus]UYP67786.1 D-lactate dehydrogenase [Thalassobacter stenotrophicus]
MPANLIARLTEILGTKRVLTSPSATERYRQGFRSGGGDALAVCLPQTLFEQWQVIEACVDADTIVIMQAANTGLTEGSTPSGTYDRDVVIISTLALDAIHVLPGAEQVVALPGATLFTLENALKPLGRVPHSEIGSSCLGASVIGGICNNSGGALVKRGPAYTELALYAQRTADGTLHLVNNLGIDLGDTPEEILNNAEAGKWRDVQRPQKLASDREYAARVREVDADTPARYNADPRRLHEASGCAGKIAVFAVRLDTFLTADATQVFYIGTNETARLTNLRRALLTEMSDLPVLAEYMHKDIYDISESHGRDTFRMIEWLGTDRLPQLFAMKGRVDAIGNRLPFVPNNVSDWLMQFAFALFPSHLPKFMRDMRQSYEHYLILKVEGPGIAEAEAILERVFAEEGAYRKCTEAEGKKALLHRFAAAGAAARYAAVHPGPVEDILALDIALRRNDEAWFEELPDEINQHLSHRLYYGHFLCHVFHQDYIVKAHGDPKAIKAAMLELLSERGAKYPAEHNVGHLYEAEPALKEHYETLDPTNTFNPGIGKTSKTKQPIAAE